MRLQEVVVSTGFSKWKCLCVVCGTWLHSNKHKIFADLDGTPFVDYYCEECANAK